MQSNARRDLFTSLVGTVPLADVLSDLPLPSPLPTPLEEIVLGLKDLSHESRKLLDSTNPALCSRITEALLSVDTSFLNMKDAAQMVPYTPSPKSPPLIRVVMAELLPQAVVRIQKLDPGLFSGSASTSASAPDTHSRSDTVQVVPVHSIPGSTLSEPHLVTKKRNKRPFGADDVSSSVSDISEPKQRKKPRKISSSSDEAEPPRKRKPKVTKERATIGRHSNQQTDKHPPKPKKKLKAPIPVPTPVPTPAPTPGYLQKGPDVLPSPSFPIHLPRVKLKGYFGLPYSGEVHVLSSSEALASEQPVSRSELLSLAVRGEGWTEQGMGFAVAPGATTGHADIKEVPKDASKKKKKKHSHHRGDQTKLANLKRFSAMVFGLFDQQMSEDDLFNRLTISEILSQVANLKQQGSLHEVPVDNLMQLMGLMDKHVLDSANLLINSVPEEMEGDAKVWRELARDRILRSADAALIILHIITAPKMPQKVHLEESVDQVLALVKFHLDNNVYPQFDPVYKAEKKDSGMLPRQKRRGGGGQATNKITNAVYHKLTEVVEIMAVLTKTQPLTDTTVLLLSSMGTLPFFVENVSLLQLSALRLVRAIFTRYEKHRDLILEEIFASLRRLPTNKRNLRNYKLSNGQHIQMLTALVLQLVQCTVVPPKATPEKASTPSEETKEEINKKSDIDIQMTNTYNLALATGKNFLAKFLKKCSGGKDEDDFRPLFENFVQDLLTTLNLPMWPASEVLLTLLGILLVQSFSNRSTEQSVRLMSLEHLGVIAARLRKDVVAPTSEHENEELVDILAQVMQSRLDRGTPSPTMLAPMDAFSENNQHLQKALIAYLNKQSESDPACAYARDFYIGQWLYDTHMELEKVLKENPTSPTAALEAFNEEVQDPNNGISSSGLALQQSEQKKDTILSFLDSKKQSAFKLLEGTLDERLAAVVTRHLASSRALTRSFDIYLQKLIRVSNEPAVHVRTRAMKALSSIVAADPGILSRPDMQRAVEFRFCDTSTLVREAAVDLIGRFVLSRPDLTSKYYNMIAERIRDSGVSVRKRVIKILKDICVMQPDFPKINDICVKMIRRITDEEAIKQLVSSVFCELWFAPLQESSDKKEILLRRVTNITAVVDICKEYEWFEQLLEHILKNEDQAATQAVLNVCQMMVDCLVENVLSLDENSAKSSSSTSSLLSCIITLYLFCNVKPVLLLNHATTLHPYLSSACAANKDVTVLHFVSKILKEVVPLMEHPSQTFLAGLEEDLIKLIMKHGQVLIHSCVECLGAVVNSVTHNYNLVKDCFQRFFKCLEQMHALHSQDPTSPQLKTHRPSLLRSLFTVGVLCKFFNFDVIIPQPSGVDPVSSRVYSHLIYFFKNGDEEIQIKTVKGLGLFCIRYPELMMDVEMRSLINEWLTKDCASTKKIEVLRNLRNYLKEVEVQLRAADTKWEKEGADKENLQEFGDQHSSVSSNIAQAFLQPMLESFLHTELQVRLGALQAILLILRQGLVHPAQCVPYLMTMSTDPDQNIKVKADQHLTDHTSRYGHLMQTQLLSGIKKSYEFQKLIVGDGARGYSTDNVGNSSSLLSHMYILARPNKQHRRVLLKAMLRHFEDYEKNSLGLLLYLADTLAYLPYNTLEEPLFVVHHVDMTISIIGSNLLQQFKEILTNKDIAGSEDNEDEAKLSEQNCDLQQLSDCSHSCQGCFLLLLLKQHLKKSYGLSDSKCEKYSPNESNKSYDKVANRRGGITFDPEQVVAMVKQEALCTNRFLLSKEECISRYLEFKQLMDKLDPFEGDDDGSDQEASLVSTNVTESNQLQAPQEKSEVPRPPIHGRSSRASSSSSISSRKGKKEKSIHKPKKKKKRAIISSGSSEEDDPNWT